MNSSACCCDRPQAGPGVDGPACRTGPQELGAQEISGVRACCEPAATCPASRCSAGTVAAPSPSASCIITVSSQRPNLKPTFGCVPIIEKPALVWTAIDPALAESPITAIICRKPRASQSRDQPLQQLQSDPAPVRGRLEIDRVLDRETIGGPGPVRARIGVAEQPAVAGRDQIGKAAVDEPAKAPRHLGEVGRLEFERRRTEAHGLVIDGGHDGEVGLGGGPDVERGHFRRTSQGHGEQIIFARRKRKAPAARPGLGSIRLIVAVSRAGRAAAAAA